MNDKNKLQEALEELDKMSYEEFVSNGHGWIITDEDDILDPWRNEKKLQEGLDVVDWSNVFPCDILYCETEVQHAGEIQKRRPVLTLYKSGSAENPIIYAMQITSTPPNNGFRSKFKYKLQDWAKIGLKKPSYINYDHIVRNANSDIRNTNHMKITNRDVKGLLDCLERDYNDLIELGYKSSYDKELLDDFIMYLKNI